MSVSFVRSSADPCIYVPGDDCPIFVATYVDDLIIARKNGEEMLEVRELLQSRLMMMDTGELLYCLGVTIAYTRFTGTASEAVH